MPSLIRPIRAIPPLSEQDEARFWSKVALPDEQGCMLWLAGRNGAGYGLFALSGTSRLAHRVSYVLAYDTIPSGMVIDHLCRRPACVAPPHLEPVTHAENMRRGEICKARAAWQDAKTHCPQGHPYDEKNTYMTPRGMRNCRLCRRSQSSAYYYRHEAAQ